ncbi:hypothetical protein [uncultured Maricaulis sp.]|uniref:hypothetical protein n=1 Tax=uncultured Maricaulis sp. TaxID=174710 RepID=UPI0030D8759C|tara:strand:+ start:130068 stop:130286 length:219 start_codon:yes stop_codon:yes gene_type:complete
METSCAGLNDELDAEPGTFALDLGLTLPRLSQRLAMLAHLPLVLGRRDLKAPVLGRQPFRLWWRRPHYGSAA